MMYFILNISHQHFSVAIASFFRVMLRLREYKGTNIVSCECVISNLCAYIYYI